MNRHPALLFAEADPRAAVPLVLGLQEAASAPFTPLMVTGLSDWPAPQRRTWSCWRRDCCAWTASPCVARCGGTRGYIQTLRGYGHRFLAIGD